MESGLAALTALVLETQATGNRSFAADFEARYSKRCEDYQADILNLGLEKIPVDIRFDFQTR